jgi:hypothetical protein
LNGETCPGLGATSAAALGLGGRIVGCPLVGSRVEVLVKSKEGELSLLLALLLSLLPTGLLFATAPLAPLDLLPVFVRTAAKLVFLKEV